MPGSGAGDDGDDLIDFMSPEFTGTVPKLPEGMLAPFVWTVGPPGDTVRFDADKGQWVVEWSEPNDPTEFTGGPLIVGPGETKFAVRNLGSTPIAVHLPTPAGWGFVPGANADLSAAPPVLSVEQSTMAADDFSAIRARLQSIEADRAQAQRNQDWELAADEHLDKIAGDWGLKRPSGQSDYTLRNRIRVIING